MEELKNPAYSKNVIEFVAVANEFLKFLENASELTLTKFVDTTHRVLPMLYFKGTMLPLLDESFDEFNEKFVTQDDYSYIEQSILTIFGEHNYYDEIFDPLRQENDEPARLSIAEGFADIYQDLKDFIMQYRVGTDEVMLNAIWECKQSFEQYWGQRIVNILRVLHYLKYTVVDLEDSAQKQKFTNEFDYNNIDTSNWIISKRQEEYGDEE